MKQTIRGKLVAIQNGLYINYVFQNLDEIESSELRYITVTKCPNWHCPIDLKLRDTGFITYEYVNAGDSYVDKDTKEEKTYSYTALYFMNFIPEQTEDNIKEFKF